jgi:hypothetical protein
MKPRIYTYKVTFEEIPDWYWGSHKEKKYGETYLGSPNTHAWKWEFYTPHLEILELFPYTNEGWVEAQNVENRCIKPDLNNPLCLNEHYGGVISIEARKRGGVVVHKERDDLGRSLRTLKLHEERDEFGRSVRAMKLNEITHKEKDELGRSVHGVKTSERLHEVKDHLGRSAHAVKTLGKVHDKKDDLGRSVHGVKCATTTHKEKDDLGRSVTAVKAAATTNSQKWRDPQHPELGEHTSGILVQMQQRRGYLHGIENRVRVK